MSNDTNFISFSRPFIEACKKIFTTMLDCDLEAQKPLVKKDSTSRGDITAMISLSGEYDMPEKKFSYGGMLVISFPYQTYFNIAGKMLGETYTSYVPDIHDLGGEIANMIMGNAKRDLVEMGYKSGTAIPSMIEGKNHSINYPAGTLTILIPFTSQYGEVFMEICYSANE